MRPLSSYQSSHATPPGDNHYLDEECTIEHCRMQAVEQQSFDEALCPGHLREWHEWDEADRTME